MDILRFAHIVDGRVENVVVAPPDWTPEKGEAVEVTGPVNIGDLFDGREFSPDPEVVAKLAAAAAAQAEKLAAKAALAADVEALKDAADPDIKELRSLVVKLVARLDALEGI